MWDTPHEMLRAMDVDELGDMLAVHMLTAFPESEVVVYASEDNVVDARNYAQAVYQDIEQRFGFVNGTYEELTGTSTGRTTLGRYGRSYP